MTTAADDLARLQRDVADSFIISRSGRIERGPSIPSGPRQPQSPPRRSAGPRLYFAGCAAGNIFHMCQDVAAATAERVQALAAAAPPWSDPETPPDCLNEIVALLSRETPVQLDGPEVVFRLPNGLDWGHEATLVRSGAPDGERLLAHLRREGLPKSLIQAGFLSLDDFWWPWCVAMKDREITAMAFTPRLGTTSAEIGVFTFPAFRSRGFAAAVTAGWSSLASLEGRDLIYGTRLTNRSSRLVAARLGLRPIGARMRIG